MDKRDQDTDGDDGIIAEDITQLVEHIELTGPQRLVDAPEWEMARPAADLDDAPILVGDVGGGAPDLDDLHASEDLELFTETQFDIGRHLPDGGRLPDSASELAAERARWQKRVESLLMNLADRDQLLLEREQKIEELSARLATLSLEHENLATDLGDLQAAAESAPAEESAPVLDPMHALGPEAQSHDISTDNTAEFPRPDMTRRMPALAPDAALRVRRYLIGLDMVGSVHEVARARVNIGRTTDNDLRILDPTVSRLHAMLSVRGSEAMVVDANSRNGLFVNGIQVRYAKLEDGDVVTFGTVRYRFRVGTGTSDGAYGVA